MRGLTVFIADLRNCRARDLEEKRINKELANIRSKFKDPNLNGYQKKKYVCKLVYIYILGWNVDFGHNEAIQLLSSNIFSEKRIGYLATTLLIPQQQQQQGNSSTIDHFNAAITTCIKRDLADHHNEVHACLALSAIANLVGDFQGVLDVVDDVYKLAITSSSSFRNKNFIQKKAALCLLRLYKKQPEVVPMRDYASKLLPFMSDADYSVALTMTSLISSACQQYPQEFVECVGRAIGVLYKIVTSTAFDPEYTYYKVPVPWLQVKLLRLLQYYPPSESNKHLPQLNRILSTIINPTTEMPTNPQQKNAVNAILFEAISLAIHINAQSDVCVSASKILGGFIQHKENNIRYLALEELAHLAGFVDTLDGIKVHQETIVTSLSDKDISVQRRALDLLYSMCDYSNCSSIVSELLKYLGSADYNIREEMVIKIAILSERFTTDFSWYVDVILQLITLAGDHVGDEVWHRVVQIVSNNEGLQSYTAKNLMDHMKNEDCHDIILRISGHVLGEFGHVIADEPGYSPIEQFTAIKGRMSTCQTSTRASFLTTLLKFSNIFPEIKEHVVSLLDSYRYVLDVELQQRACEYYTMITFSSNELVEAVCDVLPPFPEREGDEVRRALVAAAAKGKIANDEGGDKRTWVVGGREANIKKVEEQHKIQQQIDSLESAKSSTKKHEGNDVDSFTKLLLKQSGILYEDSTIQIGMKMEYNQETGKVGIFIGNKLTTPLNEISIIIDQQAESDEHLKFDLLQALGNNIPAQTQLCQMYSLECIKAPKVFPIITFIYTVNSELKHIETRLPIPITKFLEPIALSSADFFARWKQIGGEQRECIIQHRSNSSTASGLHNLVGDLNFCVLKGVDPQVRNIVGAGIYHSTDLGKVGCLLRVEFDESFVYNIKY